MNLKIYKATMKKLNERAVGAGEIIQQLRPCTALVEDLSLVPQASTYACSQPPSIAVSGDLSLLLASTGYC